MRKLTLIILTVLLLWTINYGLSTSYAEIPHLINYQGRLTDSQGQPITGTKSITFRIYEMESGGSPIWQETHTATLDRGIYNLFIGGITPLNLPFDRQYYLGIQVGSDPEMAPRQRLATSAYAFTSENANKIANVEVSTTPQANKLLPLDANAKLPAGIVSSNTQLFTSSGSWICPAGVTTVLLTICGSGGGGGGGKHHQSDRSYTYGGGGGAGGNALMHYPVSVTPGQNYTITIGVGGISGAAGAPGNAGGTTTFGTISVAGGAGGGPAGGYSGGAGGSDGEGPGGTGLIRGGSGGGGGGGYDGQGYRNGTGGAGGNGRFNGTGGAGGGSTVGSPCSGYGAGGGGGGTVVNGSEFGGGNGTAGFVLIQW